MQGIEENCYASAFLQAVSFSFAKIGGLHMWAIFIGQELGRYLQRDGFADASWRGARREPKPHPSCTCTLRAYTRTCIKGELRKISTSEKKKNNKHKARFEPATFCSTHKRPNHYTTAVVAAANHYFPPFIDKP